MLGLLAALSWESDTVWGVDTGSNRHSTVVVLPFQVDISVGTEDVVEVLPRFLEEELAYAGVSVLERGHLEHLLGEHQLAETGWTAAPGMIETGRLLGAGFLVKSRLYGYEPTNSLRRDRYRRIMDVQREAAFGKCVSKHGSGVGGFMLAHRNSLLPFLHPRMARHSQTILRHHRCFDGLPYRVGRGI